MAGRRAKHMGSAPASEGSGARHMAARFVKGAKEPEQVEQAEQAGQARPVREPVGNDARAPLPAGPGRSVREGARALALTGVKASDIHGGERADAAALAAAVLCERADFVRSAYDRQDFMGPDSRRVEMKVDAVRRRSYERMEAQMLSPVAARLSFRGLRQVLGFWLSAKLFHPDFVQWRKWKKAQAKMDAKELRAGRRADRKGASLAKWERRYLEAGDWQGALECRAERDRVLQRVGGRVPYSAETAAVDYVALVHGGYQACRADLSGTAESRLFDALGRFSEACRADGLSEADVERHAVRVCRALARDVPGLVDEVRFVKGSQGLVRCAPKAAETDADAERRARVCGGDPTLAFDAPAALMVSKGLRASIREASRAGDPALALASVVSGALGAAGGDAGALTGAVRDMRAHLGDGTRDLVAEADPLPAAGVSKVPEALRAATVQVALADALREEAKAGRVWMAGCGVDPSALIEGCTRALDAHAAGDGLEALGAANASVRRERVEEARVKDELDRDAKSAEARGEAKRGRGAGELRPKAARLVSVQAAQPLAGALKSPDGSNCAVQVGALCRALSEKSDERWRSLGEAFGGASASEYLSALLDVDVKAEQEAKVEAKVADAVEGKGEAAAAYSAVMDMSLTGADGEPDPEATTKAVAAGAVLACLRAAEELKLEDAKEAESYRQKRAAGRGLVIACLEQDLIDACEAMGADPGEVYGDGWEDHDRGLGEGEENTQRRRALAKVEALRAAAGIDGPPQEAEAQRPKEPGQRAPERKAPGQRAPKATEPEQKAPEVKATERKDPEQKAPEGKAPERRTPKPRAPEQKVLGQKEAKERARKLIPEPAPGPAVVPEPVQRPEPEPKVVRASEAPKLKPEEKSQERPKKELERGAPERRPHQKLSQAQRDLVGDQRAEGLIKVAAMDLDGDDPGDTADLSDVTRALERIAKGDGDRPAPGARDESEEALGF